jgi:hypothetical protein
MMGGGHVLDGSNKITSVVLGTLVVQGRVRYSLEIDRKAQFPVKTVVTFA